METIQVIEEATFKKKKDDWCSYDGFLVTTNKQIIKLGIENGQSCCENWGYFMTNDDISEFIGAELLSVSITDDCLNEAKAPDKETWFEGGVMFVNLETNRGTLQFTAYNEHNGYYGHEAIVISNQLSENEYL